MDFQILYALQNLHTSFLDSFFLALTSLVGSIGQMWLIAGAILALIPRTRKCGFCVLLAYVLAFISGQLILKDLIARPRPCALDTGIALLVERPTSFSCPSTHTAFAFAAATAIFMHYRKWGTAALILAAVIGFSRLYLFVHFPTDVLFGALLGVAMAVSAFYILKAADNAIKKRKKYKT